MIEKHLSNYQIYAFGSGYDWQSDMEFRLADDQKLLRRIRKHMKYEAFGRNTDQSRKEFYDHVADTPGEGPLHSFKFSAIAKCGEFVDDNLGPQDRVLDLGCNIGYLSTYYASRSSGRLVYGWDNSSGSIAAAKKHAKRLGIDNVRFSVVNVSPKLPECEVDTIVSTCTLGYLDNVGEVFKTLVRCLSAKGRLVSVEPLGDPKSTIPFVEKANAAGFKLVRTGWVDFIQFDTVQAYPSFEFKVGETVEAIEVDWTAQFAKIHSRMEEIIQAAG